MIEDEKPGTGFVLYFNGSRRTFQFISKNEVDKYGLFACFFYSVVREKVDINSWYIRGIQIKI